MKGKWKVQWSEVVTQGEHNLSRSCEPGQTQPLKISILPLIEPPTLNPDQMTVVTKWPITHSHKFQTSKKKE